MSSGWYNCKLRFFNICTYQTTNKRGRKELDEIKITISDNAGLLRLFVPLLSLSPSSCIMYCHSFYEQSSDSHFTLSFLTNMKHENLMSFFRYMMVCPRFHSNSLFVSYPLPFFSSLHMPNVCKFNPQKCRFFSLVRFQITFCSNFCWNHHSGWSWTRGRIQPFFFQSLSFHASITL